MDFQLSPSVLPYSLNKMHLRSGKRYQPYNQQCRRRQHKKEAHSSTISHETCLPLEIYYKIIEEMLHDPNLIVKDFLSYIRVCKAWASEVSRDISLCAPIQTRLMHLAARQNNIKALDILLSCYGADVNSNNGTGWTIAKQECQQVAESFADETEWTVLHTAVFHGHVKMFELLVNKYKVLDDKDMFYITDLSELAMCNVQIDMWFMLVKMRGELF